jgi:hypothetical protein
VEDQVVLGFFLIPRVFLCCCVLLHRVLVCVLVCVLLLIGAGDTRRGLTAIIRLLLFVAVGHGKSPAKGGDAERCTAQRLCAVRTETPLPWLPTARRVIAVVP